MPNTKLTYKHTTTLANPMFAEIWASPNKYQFTANKHIKTVSTATAIDTYLEYTNTKHEDMKTYASEIDNNVCLEPSLERLEPSLEWLEPSHERLEPSLEWLEPSLEWLEPSLEWLEPSLEWLEPSLEWLEPSLEWLEPSLEWLEASNKGIHTSIIQYYSRLHKN